MKEMKFRKKLVLTYYHIINKLFNPLHEWVKFDNITSEKDIPYDTEHSICTADVYYKGDLSVKRPVFINIHGGGFVSGDKLNRTHISQELANRGYFVYVPNYRLASTDPFPAMIIDCINAVNYLHNIKDKYNLDMSRVVLSGDSAGAFLVSMMYAMIHNEEYRQSLNMPKITVDIHCLVPFCPPFAVIDTLTKRSPFGVNKMTAYMFTDMKINVKNKQEYKYYNEMEVANYISSNYNNVFLCYAKHDYFCKGHGDKFIKVLKANNCEFDTFKSTKFLDNHCYHMILFTKISVQCLDAVDAYIAKCFAKNEQKAINQ